MSWSFVVAPGVVPAADAVALLHEARVLVPDAVVVAARVVLPGGALDPGSEPVPRILDKGLTVEAAALGLLEVRAVRPGALLVRTDVPAGAAFARAPSVSASVALLRDARGVLAPLAVARRAVPAPRESLRASLRLLRSPAWTREERLMQLFALARR